MPIQFTHTNKLMHECLQEIEDYWTQEKARLVAREAAFERETWDEVDKIDASKKPKISADAFGLAAFMFSEVVRHQGCYLLRSEFSHWDVDPDGEFVPTEHRPDRTGYEDFENHRHISDYFISKEPGIHFLIMGLASAEFLYLKLRVSFPDVHFRICVIFPVRPFEFDPEDTHIRDDCVVRFHAVREGEVIYGPLEEFRHEAMGILEF